MLVVRPRADGTLRESAVPRLAALADLARLAVVNADARAHAELLARTDELTGLPNRRAFMERLPGEVARALRAGSPLALASLDLDRFKRVNDRHGHAVGDQVLAAVAEALRGTVREGELLARVGGEEFGWILPVCDRVEAMAAAERARRAVAEVHVPGVARSTVSVGIALLAPRWRRGVAPARRRSGAVPQPRRRAAIASRSRRRTRRSPGRPIVRPSRSRP